MSGNFTADARGIYGTKGAEDSSNHPGARREFTTWIDSEDDLWLLGGIGYDKDGSIGYLNDLWRYVIDITIVIG
jgi:hypothetical protein